VAEQALQVTGIGMETRRGLGELGVGYSGPLSYVRMASAAGKSELRMRDDLETILSSTSPIAVTVRCQLQALLAGLREAARSFDLTATENAALSRLIRQWEECLELEAIPSLEPEVPPIPNKPKEPRLEDDPLQALAGEFFSIEEVRLHSDAVEVSKLTPAELWRFARHLLLRLPAGLHREWQPRWDALREDSNVPVQPIAGPSEELLYPSFGPLPGLALSLSAPLHSRLIGDFPSEEPTVRLVSELLWFIDHEPNLKHVYRPLYSFGFAPVDERYGTELIERLRRLVNAIREGDRLKQLRVRLDLDEAIHSLTFDPPPACDSWWARLQEHSRKALFELREKLLAEGRSIHLQILLDRYSEIRGLSRDDLGVDHSGRPGEIVSCLRLFARIEQQTLPGRVLYRRM
jgi:hypothetical protein